MFCHDRREHLLREIQSARVVSFDIFDTLVVRPYMHPIDVFTHLEQMYQCVGFAKARIEAEALVREKIIVGKLREEVTFDEIYQAIGSDFQSMKVYESEWEANVCQQNPEIYEIYKYCIEKNKKVVFSSDMYLPVETILRILGKCNYGDFKKLYLSNDIGKTKAFGSLFQQIISDNPGIRPSQILHIGDHEFGDVANARRLGLTAVHYTRPLEQFLGQEVASGYVRSLLGSYELEQSIFVGIAVIDYLSRKREKNSYWRDFGVIYASLPLIGFASWINSRVIEDNIGKVCFLSRDGLIIKKLIEHLFPKKLYDSTYLLASRRCTYLPFIESFSRKEADRYLQNISNVDPLVFWRSLDVRNEELERKFVKTFQNNVMNDDEETRAKLIDFFNANWALWKKEMTVERGIYDGYLYGEGFFQERVALVDIGWSGSMQSALIKYRDGRGLTSPLYGFYFGTRAGSSLPKNKYYAGYVLDYEEPSEKAQVIQAGVDILETLFTSTHPTVVKVDKIDDSYVPVYGSTHLKDDEKSLIINSIQEGVLSIAKRFEQIFKFKDFVIDPNISFRPFDFLIKTPTVQDYARLSRLVCTASMVGVDSHTIAPQLSYLDLLVMRQARIDKALVESCWQPEGYGAGRRLWRLCYLARKYGIVFLVKKVVRRIWSLM